MVSIDRQQSGFAVLLLLFVLLGAGITSFSQVSDLTMTSSPGFSKDQYALQAARQSLLTYAALYPFHYGPRGAGPGHLPCPDTDRSTAVYPAQSSGRDGPNPPCGAGRVATGQLPRHVNLGARRYVFHTEASQRLDYSVASDLINNPINRVVNDGVVLGKQGQSAYLAWIAQPLEEQGLSGRALSKVPVTRQSLLPGIVQAVSAWIVWQADRQQHGICLPPSTADAASWPEEVDILSIIATRVIASSTPLPIAAVDGAMNTCQLDASPSLNDEEWLLEGVPLASHWFVRNRWHERIVVSVSESCRSTDGKGCRLVATQGKSDDEVSNEGLRFIWQVI